MSESNTPTSEAVSGTADAPKKKLEDFLGKLMGDVSRLHAQTDFFARRTTAEFNVLGERVDHIEKCLGILFDALHLQMPVPTPKLLDAKVELVEPESFPEDETCELRVSYSSAVHPVYGNYQVLIGSGEDVQVTPVANLHPIVVNRITEAFGQLIAANTLKEGAFYYVRLSLYHARPINVDSVLVTNDVPAANDDAGAETESGHVDQQ